MLPEQKAEARFWVVNWGRIEWLRGRFREKGTGRITVVGSDPSRALFRWGMKRKRDILTKESLK